MFYETSLEEFCGAPGVGVQPVVRERPADLLTPVGAAVRLFVPGQPAFLLESAEGGETVGRYSFLGIHAAEGIGRQGESLQELRAFLDRYAVGPTPVPAALPAAAVGYLSYDAVRLVERLPDRHADKPTPAFLLHHFEDILVFDHLKQRIYLVTLSPEHHSRGAEAYHRAQGRLDVLESRLFAAAATRPGYGRGLSETLPAHPVAVEPSDAVFMERVEQAREYIAAGDVFQVVLSRTFSRRVDAAPLNVYRALRMINPSPFMFYLEMGDHQVIGASPEDLVRVSGRRVETLPIAGTRRRGASAEDDARLAAELLADPKERAEHTMLVDLARNDVGRIAEAGSVQVERMMEVEKFSHVMHLVSRVAGRLRPEHDALDALFACFPAGTLSGAPKIRAMELIDELEDRARGVYGGAVAYFDGRGNLDSCIAIRTALLRDGVATFKAGAGIVADSDPRAEEQETRTKAAALVAALEQAGRL